MPSPRHTPSAPVSAAPKIPSNAQKASDIYLVDMDSRPVTPGPMFASPSLQSNRSFVSRSRLDKTRTRGNSSSPGHSPSFAGAAHGRASEDPRNAAEYTVATHQELASEDGATTQLTAMLNHLTLSRQSGRCTGTAGRSASSRLDTKAEPSTTVGRPLSSSAARSIILPSFGANSSLLPLTLDPIRTPVGGMSDLSKSAAPESSDNQDHSPVLNRTPQTALSSVPQDQDHSESVTHRLDITATSSHTSDASTRLTAKPTDTDTTESAHDCPSVTRKGKAEILSLYSLGVASNTASSLLQSPHSSHGLLIDVSEIEYATGIPLPTTPTTAHSTRLTDHLSAESELRSTTPHRKNGASHATCLPSAKRPETGSEALATDPRALPVSTLEPNDMPSLDSATDQTYHNRLQEIHDEIHELAELYAEQRSADARFQGGFEEVVHRIKAAVRTSGESLNEEAADLNGRLYRLELEHQRLLGASTQTKVDLDEAYKQVIKSQAEAAVLMREVSQLLREGAKNAHKEKKLIKYIARLSEENRRLKEAGETSRESQPIAVVLLEGHPRMFNPDLLRGGEAGGKAIVEQLVHAVHRAAEVYSPGTQIQVVCGQIFLDVPRLHRYLRQAGVLERFSEFRNFCDGLNGHLNLISVIDVDNKEQARTKIKEHIKLYSQLQNCVMVVLGAHNADGYRDSLYEYATPGNAAFYAIRSNADISQDPYLFLGTDRLIQVDGMFGAGDGTWRDVSRGAHDTSLTSSEVGSTTQSHYARSVSSVSTVRPGSPEHKTYRVKQSARTRVAQVNGTDAGYPPWAKRERAPHLPPTLSHIKSRSNTISVIDRRYSLSPVSTAQSITRQLDANTLPHGKETQAPTIIVPFRKGEDGYIGGSPPESDDDEPSVHLPHSALKHVQRPTVIETHFGKRMEHGFKIQAARVHSPTPGSESSFSTSTYTSSEHSEHTSKRRSARSRVLPYKQSMVSSSIRTPLGFGSQPSAARDEMMGFKAHRA